MSKATLQRRPLVKQLLKGADDNLLVIAGLGSPNWDITEAGDVAQLVKDARTRKGPVFRLVKVMVEKLEFVMPPQDGAHLKDRFRQALLGST